jgi:hypothetical protein
MKQITLFTLFSWLIMANQVFATGSYGPTFTVDHNTDRQGANYKEMPVADLGDCQNRCANDAKCKAFTYVHPNGQPPNYNNPKPHCWLKHGVPGKRKDNCCITGVKGQGKPSGGPSYGASFMVEHNTDRQGGDYHKQTVSNLSQCQSKCAQDQKCKAFTFVRINGQPPNYNNSQPMCWLKNSVPGKRADNCCTTGVKK